jgi:hypothetical protein
MRFERKHEATITRAEFLRLLPAATGDSNFCEINGQYVGRGWSLRLTPINMLKIGKVEMERHRVEIEFDGMSADEQDRFMERFSRHYQRGGG